MQLITFTSRAAAGSLVSAPLLLMVMVVGCQNGGALEAKMQVAAGMLGSGDAVAGAMASASVQSSMPKTEPDAQTSTPNSQVPSAGDQAPIQVDPEPAGAEQAGAPVPGFADPQPEGMVADMAAAQPAASDSATEPPDTDAPDSGSEDGAAADGARHPPCMQSPRQVILMGDSYMNWVSHTFPQDMAKNFGNGTQGVWDVPYVSGGRLYAIGAWAMGSGGIGLIPDQLTFALADDPNIIATIMTGGGNDLLVPSPEWPGGGDCKNSDAMPPLPVCQQIAEKGLEAAGQLMQRSADAGIRDVVFFFYPSVPAPTLIGGTHPNELLAWVYPMAKSLCDGAAERTEGRLHCHFLDTRPIFEGHPEFFAPTDIHPNSAGSDALTKAIAALMRDRCIAQPAASGCCEP